MTRASATAASRGRLWPGLVFAAFVIAPQAAPAQNSLFSSTPSTGLISPVPATRSDIFGPSNLSIPSTPPGQTQQAPNMANTTASIPVVPAGQVALALSARFGKDAVPISGGLTLRVYGAQAGTQGNFNLVKGDKNPPTNPVPPSRGF